MKKNTKSTKSLTATKLDTRESLAAELERIRLARETEEKSFRDSLEKLYADHRKAMKDLAARRSAAWEQYSSAKKSAPKASKKSAKKEEAPSAEAAE